MFAVVDRRDRPLGDRALAFVLLGTVVGSAFHVVVEGSRGQTVGKKLLGVAVVLADGSTCGYRAASIRTALRVVDALPFGYLLGLLSIRVTDRRQRLGDIAANTVVVRVPARNRTRAPGGEEPTRTSPARTNRG